MPVSLFSGSLTGTRTSFSALIWLLAVYFLFRVLFSQWPDLKEAFIYPTGILVNLSGLSGEYAQGEWRYQFQTVRFILGELCSGTTFFSLVTAYLIYQWRLRYIGLSWLALAYPVTILANAIRVTASMILYLLLDSMQLTDLNEPLHIVCGVVTFLTTLLALAYLIDITRKNHG